MNFGNPSPAGYCVLLGIVVVIVIAGWKQSGRSTVEAAKGATGPSEVEYWQSKAQKRLRGWHVAELERNRARAQARGLRLTLLHRPSVREALNLSCVVYGHCAELWRKAKCETGGTFNPRSRNRSSSASGLLQFLPSTWAGTPFGGFDVLSPYANALGAGWMHANGRGGEWDCR